MLPAQTEQAHFSESPLPFDFFLGSFAPRLRSANSRYQLFVVAD